MRGDDPEGLCHCGERVKYGFDGDPDHHRGMCVRCDAVRCDVDPAACHIGPKRDMYLRLPLHAEQTIHISGAFPVTEATWSHFMDILSAMKPGLVTVPDGDAAVDSQR